ncbi:hypothetical protein LS684_16590 [Cytobacillus spongiae]|jgi:hypothetical protein|uniref:CBO0543 family protein n=1 Tax=Cytobacillus spongiae TaxID=2901381 RepID=UPI001F1DD77F|nr:CBO0543 family protein [Cytobacillus spongiae]UII55257.1 hypothetical protein LS684_16590 [Cytobacillus spongiae]
MHVLLAILLCLGLIKRGQLTGWKDYHSTLLYIATCNLLYNCLTEDYKLWKYNADFFENHIMTDLLYSFIILPIVALLFLTNFPNEVERKKKGIYVLKWVIACLLTEALFLSFNRLELMHGYKYWMEIFFYTTMFLMIRLHTKKPLATYFLSIIIIITLIQLFDVPIK